jgi:hypothetical protein
MERFVIAILSIQIYYMQIGHTLIKKDCEGHKRTFIYVRCATCGIMFPKLSRFVRKHGGVDSGRHFCGTACATASRITRIKCECAMCGKEFERKRSNIKNKTFCSRKCKDMAQTAEVGILQCGHYVNGNGSYRNKALRHYEPHCEWCGNEFVEVLDVHHIDGNRLNNNIKNLIILCPICHALVTRKIVVVRNRKPVIIIESEQLKKYLGAMAQ